MSFTFSIAILNGNCPFENKQPKDMRQHEITLIFKPAIILENFEFSVVKNEEVLVI